MAMRMAGPMPAGPMPGGPMPGGPMAGARQTQPGAMPGQAPSPSRRYPDTSEMPELAPAGPDAGPGADNPVVGALRTLQTIVTGMQERQDPRAEQLKEHLVGFLSVLARGAGEGEAAPQAPGAAPAPPPQGRAEAQGPTPGGVPMNAGMRGAQPVNGGKGAQPVRQQSVPLV